MEKKVDRLGLAGGILQLMLGIVVLAGYIRVTRKRLDLFCGTAFLVIGALNCGAALGCCEDKEVFSDNS